MHVHRIKSWSGPCVLWWAKDSFDFNVRLHLFGSIQNSIYHIRLQNMNIKLIHCIHLNNPLPTFYYQVFICVNSLFIGIVMVVNVSPIIHNNWYFVERTIQSVKSVAYKHKSSNMLPAYCLCIIDNTNKFQVTSKAATTFQWALGALFIIQFVPFYPFKSWKFSLLVDAATRGQYWSPSSWPMDIALSTSTLNGLETP